MPDTFPYLDTNTGQVVHIAVVRDAAGKTHLIPQPMPTGFSAPEKDK